MDHPLIEDGQKRLRQQVIHFFKNAYKVHRSSNIVFVCGGNEDAHMRTLFREHCNIHLPEYEVFLPEAAMSNIFSGEVVESFDITEFEELVAELSHAIVVFPEAPGSFAETGYFSAINKIAEKCILALDFNRQRSDSFISLGPAKKISSISIFQPTIQLDYNNPDFNIILERIRRIGVKKYSKKLKISTFKELTSYELSAIIHEIVNMCSIATFNDVLYIMRGIFEGKLSAIKTQRLMSILFGADYLQEVGQYGHLKINSAKAQLLEIKDGFRKEATEIRLSLADVYQGGDSEFLGLLEGARDVD